MAHNFAKEYAARQARARDRGFSGYGQERKARVDITREFKRQVERGYKDLVKPPKARSEAHELLLKARAEIIGESKKFVRGKEKLSPELKAQLRKLYPAEQFYPIMRSLYG